MSPANDRIRQYITGKNFEVRLDRIIQCIAKQRHEIRLVIRDDNENEHFLACNRSQNVFASNDVK